MKILFTISSLRSGGAERVLSTLANSLSDKHTVVIVKSDNKDPFYEIDENITIDSLDLYKSSKNVIKKALHNLTVLSSIRNSIKEHNPDIVISFMTRTNIYVLLSTMFLNKKIIISERTNYDAIKSKLWKFLRDSIYPLSNGMVVLSQYDYDKYHFVKNKKIIFNPLFVDNTKTENRAKEKVILAVGSLFEGKAFDILIESLSKIDKQLLSEWKVYIIGEGDKKEELENLIKSLNLDQTVILLGLKKNIEEYYKEASIFVSTSRIEGFPNALSEALSFGCASVATDCITGPSELVDNEKNGFLVKVDDVDMISKKLKLLMQNETLREEFSKKSIELSKKYKSENIVKEWEEYINEIV